MAVAPQAEGLFAVHERVAHAVAAAVAEASTGTLPPARTVEIPVCYGGAQGPAERGEVDVPCPEEGEQVFGE